MSEGTGMSDSNGREVSWRGLLHDIRMWFGVLGGVSASAGFIFIFGQEVIQAPAIASEAMKQANTAAATAQSNAENIEDVEDELDDTVETLRIVFCTAEGNWLSTQARAQLECWRIQGLTPPPGTRPQR